MTSPAQPTSTGTSHKLSDVGTAQTGSDPRVANASADLQPTAKLSALESLPSELLLAIVEQLKYRTLKRLQRVSKRMQAIVATRTPTLDKRLWRVRHSSSLILGAHRYHERTKKPPLQLHPFLKNLSLSIWLDNPMDGPALVTRRNYFLLSNLDEAKIANATYPPIKKVIFDSFIAHDCLEFEEDDDDLHESATTEQSAQSDGRPLCTPPHHGASQGDGALSVAEFARVFVESLSKVCQAYGDADFFQPSEFRGWGRHFIDPKTEVASFAEPIWEGRSYESDSDAYF